MWAIPAEQLVFCPLRNILLVSRRRLCTFTKCVYITLIFLSLEPGNVSKQITGVKRVPVLLTVNLPRFLCSLYAWKPSGDNSDTGMPQAAQNLSYKLSALLSSFPLGERPLK